MNRSMSLYHHAVKEFHERYKEMILWEDENVLIISKPAYIPSAGDDVYPEGIHELLEKRTRQKLELMHRLDKDTTGVLLLVKNDETYRHFFRANWRKNARKHYLAIVSGRWIMVDTQTCLKLNVDGRKVLVDPNGRVSRTIVNTVEIFESSCLMSIQILDGTTHIIRVTASHFGHPILGDRLYGDGFSELESPNMLLHAHRLCLAMPDGNNLEIEAPVPNYWESFI